MGFPHFLRLVQVMQKFYVSDLQFHVIGICAIVRVVRIEFSFVVLFEETGTNSDAPPYADAAPLKT